MPPWTNANPAYARYQVGDWTYGQPTVLSWNEGTKLRIGRFCSIADEVIILLGGEHRVDWVTTYPFSRLFEGAKHYAGHPLSRGDVCIGNDVWIGRRAMIRSGVTIGDGAVVGAGSLVTRDVEPYSIVAGNPARHIRYRFPTEMRQALLQIAWWAWPVDRIEKAWPLILSPRIDDFINQYSPNVLAEVAVRERASLR